MYVEFPDEIILYNAVILVKINGVAFSQNPGRIINKICIDILLLFLFKNFVGVL
jgi:hypothetical protein